MKSLASEENRIESYSAGLLETLQRQIVTLSNENSELKQHRNESAFSFLEVFPGAALVCDHNGAILRANVAAAEFYGYTLPLLTRMVIEDLAHPEFVSLTSRCIRGVYDRTPFKLEAVHLDINRSALMVQMTGRMLQLDGAVYNVIFIEDIMDRKWAEDTIRRSGERFRQIAEYIEEVFWMLSPDLSRVIYANPAFETVWQRSVDAFYKAPALWFEAILEEDRPAVEKAYRTLALEGTSLECEYRIQLPDGTVRWIRNRGYAIRNEKGAIFRLAGVAVDVTVRKDYEERLQRYATELERSNEELKQFAYVASHDLKQPLRMVSSYLELLSDRYQHQLDADADVFISYAVNGAKRMHRLIDGLLSYSRMDAAKLNLSPVDLNAVFDDVRDNLKIQIESSGVTFYADALPTVNGDPLQLMQLLQNLIDNAIKFRTAEPLEIILRARKARSRWLIMISDNGIGFDVAFSKKIFNIFQRLHSDTEVDGTGLGLAICRKVMQRHGGRIWAQSMPGKGATFFLTFPLI